MAVALVTAQVVELWEALRKYREKAGEMKTVKGQIGRDRA